MEEASVAGESPDSSKQRESSAETTSGSADPVPGKRDPRLAVSREAEPPKPRRTTDTATRVLSVGADASSPEEGEDGSAPEGDGRLREAVATWVRSAEPEEGGADGGSQGADGGSPEADGGSPEADGGSPEADGGSPEADGGSPEAEEDAGTDTASDGASTDTGGKPAPGDASADADTDPAPRGTSDARQEETAADGTSRAGEDAEDASSARTGPTAGGTGDGSDDGTPESPQAAAAEGADADADNASDDEPGDAASDDADDADDTGAVTTRQDDAPDADDADTATASKSGSDDRDAEDGDADDTPEAQAPEPGDDDAGPSKDGGSGSSPAVDEPGAPDGDGAPEGEGARATGHVDQPTAVFRKPKRSVDQPTTMLKLSDAGARSEEQGGAESQAERTSKFVALKGLDDPAVRKPPGTVPPPPAAEATTSLPQIGPERTTQQPLPPKPPLDLLAELTNTPPPPQTPLRTAVRRIKIWTPLVLLLVIAFAIAQNLRPLPAPTLELTARDSYTFEGGKPEIPWPAGGQAALDVQGIGTFGSSGEQKPVPIASVAKVMTAYVILRDHPLKSGAEGPMLKIDELAEKQSDAGQESTVHVTAGDEISQREAIEAILIASANNVARLLARWDAGSEKAFVEKMNEAAKDLGMTRTTYTDPSGLNNTTVSTAVDQVKLAREAMKQPAFREVAAMMSYDDYKGTNHSNWNQLVGHNNVVGIKTGTTTSALGNLVFAAKKDVDGETRTIVGAVVRQPAGGRDNTILSAALTAGDELIRAAQGALESATILKKGDVVGYADDGLGGRTPVVVTEDVKAVGWAGLSVKLTFAADEVPHQAKAGTKVGTLTVGDGTSSAVKVPVALQEDLVEPGFTDKLTRIA
ncbi:D-alanyl-D-alanine carboxypeptidase [Streptomyces sp. NPDC047860]|uniref:D-alanyl-D-alanine carboxypeptidase n=1 Tax=Streptomyces sp. NPDC047860 TaxID=3155743 RepID=UPI0033F345B6